MLPVSVVLLIIGLTIGLLSIGLPECCSLLVLISDDDLLGLWLAMIGSICLVHLPPSASADNIENHNSKYHTTEDNKQNEMGF